MLQPFMRLAEVLDVSSPEYNGAICSGGGPAMSEGLKRADRGQQESAARTDSTGVAARSARSPYPEGSLIDSVPGIVWRADAQTLQFTFVSHYAEALLGYSVERWISEPSFWQDHIYPKDKFVITERANAVKNTGIYDLEYRPVAADGRVVWVRDIGRIVSGDAQQGELAGIIVDLSRKRTEQGGLGKSKLWLRGIIDTIPQQIWSGPSDGTLDFFNARCLLRINNAPKTSCGGRSGSGGPYSTMPTWVLQ